MIFDAPSSPIITIIFAQIIAKRNNNDSPNDWWTIKAIIHKANPDAVIAFSWNGFNCLRAGIDDYTGGDTWSKQDLTRLVPEGCRANWFTIMRQWTNREQDCCGASKSSRTSR